MIATLFAAFLLPKMGKLVDKHGPRIVLIYTIILLGIGCMIFGAAANFLMLAFAFGFLRFFGQGSLMLGSANIITQWFDKKRGFALGLMGLGFAISMGLHPPISDFLITTYGWRHAWTSWGGMRNRVAPGGLAVARTLCPLRISGIDLYWKSS